MNVVASGHKQSYVVTYNDANHTLCARWFELCLSGWRFDDNIYNTIYVYRIWHEWCGVKIR